MTFSEGIASCAFAMLMAVAAFVDARERRLPNALACGLLAAGAACALAADGARGLLRSAICALLVCGSLTGFEILWRRRTGEPGQGMGDVKALFAAMVACPSVAFAGYVLGMLMLAVTGVAARRRALPFLPFFACGMLVVFAAGAVAASMPIVRAGLPGSI